MGLVERKGTDACGPGMNKEIEDAINSVLSCCSCYRAFVVHKSQVISNPLLQTFGEQNIRALMAAVEFNCV